MDPARRLWPPSDLRVGDTDRQGVIAELQRHFVEGRLTSDELSERVAQALHARTFGELATQLNDLPALPVRAPSEPAQADWKSQLLAPPLGAALILIGVLAMLWMFVASNGGHWGFFPWPLLIWGFFFFGRPYGGGRRRF